MKIGFDNNKYLKMQSEHIRERINQFGDKLYLEFGGKLFDDYHASRVLPGFAPDSKLRMLLKLADKADIVIVISAADIEKNKVRSDLGITYDVDVLRLIQSFTDKGLYVGSVVITHYSGQNTADVFKHKLESMGIKVYRHYTIDGYPGNVPLIVSDEGYGKNDYIETKRPLVVVTAPGPGSGKMATCLSQLYHENKRGVKAGYACCEASRQEILRRYYQALNRVVKEDVGKEEVYKIELLMKQAKLTTDMRKVVPAALKRAEETGAPAAAIELPDGTITTGKTTNLLGASAALLLNAVKVLGNIPHDEHLISPIAIEPIQKLKVEYLGSRNPRLHTDEVLIALSMCAATNKHAQIALEQLEKLRGCQVHTSVMLSEVDIKTFKRLGIELTSEPVYEHNRLYQ